MNTTHFFTKREGYGRQGLYFQTSEKSYFLHSVYPNVPEHYNADNADDCFYDEKTETYTDSNGMPVTPVNDWDKFLFEKNKELIGEVILDNEIDFEKDFDGMTYDEIADFVFNL